MNRHRFVGNCKKKENVFSDETEVIKIRKNDLKIVEKTNNMF